MTATPIDEARQSLDLAFEAIVQMAEFETSAAPAAARAFLEGILRLGRTIDANPHLLRAGTDCTNQYERERTTLLKRRATRLADLKALRNESVVQFPELNQPLPAALGDHPFADTFTISHVDSLLSHFDGHTDPDEEGDEERDGCAEPGRALQNILEEILPHLGIPKTAPNLKAFKKRVATVQDDLLNIRRSLLLLKSVHPSQAIHWMRDLTHKCNPDPGSPDWILSDVSHPPADLEGLRSLRFNSRSLDLGWFERFRLEAMKQVITIRAEIHTRLGYRASAVWLLRRYAQRCAL